MSEFIEAAQNGDLEKVKGIINYYKLTKDQFNDAIFSAAVNGHVNIVKLLINHEKVTEEGANNDTSCDTENDYKEIVQLLINHEKDMKTGFIGAIRVAAINGHIETVKLLIDHKKVTEEGANDAIFYAARNGHEEIVKLLLSYGVSFNNINNVNDIEIQNLFTQITRNQEIISPLLENGFTDVKNFTDEQKGAFSNERSLVHIIARYFNPKIFNNSTEENKKGKREILLNLAIANPHIEFNEILTRNPQLIKFLSIYARDNECSHKSEVIGMLFNAVSCLIQDNLIIIGNSEERIKELNQKGFENLSDEERKELNYFKGLEELNNQLEEDKKGLETNEVFKFRNKLKARNPFFDIEIITSSDTRTIDQIYESDKERDNVLQFNKMSKTNSSSSSRNR